MAAFAVMACNSALDIHKGSGDAGSVAFVFITFAVLVAGISRFLSKFNHRDNGVGHSHGQRGRSLAPDAAAHGDVRVAGGTAHARGTGRQSALAMIAISVLTCNSALAMDMSRHDGGTVVFVFGAFAALVASIGLFLAKLDGRANGVGQSQGQRGRGLGPDDAAHGDVRVVGGAAHARGTAGRQSALAMIAISVLTCNSALAIDKARHDGGSVAFVFGAFAALVASIGLFLAMFDGRTNRVGQSQGQGDLRLLAADAAAHGHVRVEGGSTDAPGGRDSLFDDV